MKNQGLWANIHAKRKRIARGSGERMRKKGEKGAPTPAQMKRAKGEEIEEKAPENQVYRVASWLRGWFEVDYNKEIEKIEKEILRLQTLRISEIKEPNWFQKIFPIPAPIC